MKNFEMINLLKDCAIAFNIPVHLIDRKNTAIFQYPDTFLKPPEEILETRHPYLQEARKMPGTLHLLKDPFNQYALFYAYENPQKETVVALLGPFLHEISDYKEVQLSLIMNDLSSSLAEEFAGYLDHLPVRTPKELASIQRVLQHVLPGKKEKEKKNPTEPDLLHHYEEYAASLESYPDTVASKQEFMERFKRGEKQAMEAYYSLMDNNLPHIKNHVRSFKNHLIRLVTELSLLCIEKGAQPDETGSLSDFHISFLETKETVEELEGLESIILRSFLERIQGVGRQSFSPLVERAQKYIFQNLTKDLTLKEIAETLNVNPNYLSGVFTKETGVSITQFINQQRITEAKELLCITEHSLMDISMLLGYNSQSYFTRVFKSVEGIGPKEFRQKYRIKEK
ncbi:AraC family transcriptional regulator [Halobacillus kuroshimensis]|uniref:AraC family transcriptional regulator n=1 Tax=Halobacillus kuroshimensis TaxID=302481 RepID=A0ABS3DUU1_9BACI|nr:AraC family transcriptional regulator [Halobacillus kuroshimensis]MBN8235111.1 AraC family transcriptional regulator [Halobacillus kuroshimensis]